MQEEEREITYSEITRSIRVSVWPTFLEEQSRPEDNYYVWAYEVLITNEGDETVTLKTRYWKIVSATGEVQEVRGAGVVGEQPVLGPGESFEYTSGCPLQTASGIMLGAYQMESETGEAFNVTIPAFSLDSPHALSRIH
jgi:ApaG protein